MTLWQPDALVLDVDAVLRGQGADPAAVRTRRPHLVEVAEQALATARPLLQLRVLYEQIKVQELRHERLLLVGGAF